jgi:HEPN domain-containing protein/predicted nucleotidyltransferase
VPAIASYGKGKSQDGISLRSSAKNPTFEKMTALPPDLLGVLRAEIARQGLTLRQVVLFGSRAKGTHRPDSDWDLLIILRETLDPSAKRRFLTRLEAALRANGIPTDLILVSESELPYKATCVGNITHYALQEGISGIPVSSAWAMDKILNQEDIMAMHREEAHRWLAHARSDVRLGRLALELYKEDAPSLGAAAFHAQQAAEKALKAFLIFHQQPFPKTHSIKQLLQLCAKIDPASAPLVEESYDVLSQCVTQGRYPDMFQPPTLEEAQESLRKAEMLFHFVWQKLSSAAF